MKAFRLSGVKRFTLRFVVTVDFLQYHLLLQFYLVLGESAVEQDVGEEFQTALQMLAQRRGVDAGLLLGSEGVEFASYAVDAVLDMIGLAVLRALEERMLDEVRRSLFNPALVAAADVDIHPRVGHPRRCVAEYYLDAVRQSVVFVHAFCH